MRHDLPCSLVTPRRSEQTKSSCRNFPLMPCTGPSKSSISPTRLLTPAARLDRTHHSLNPLPPTQVVPAVKGNAVIWPSVMDQDPQRDEPYTNHEAMPTSIGRKFASNVWIHNYDYRTPADKGCILTHKNTH